MIEKFVEQVLGAIQRYWFMYGRDILCGCAGFAGGTMIGSFFG